MPDAHQVEGDWRRHGVFFMQIRQRQAHANHHPPSPGSEAAQITRTDIRWRQVLAIVHLLPGLATPEMHRRRTLKARSVMTTIVRGEVA
jgi:hypothetical protein